MDSNGKLQISKTDLAYIAGLLDADGCIVINAPRKGRYHCIRVTITNRNKDVLIWVKHLFGGRLFKKKAKKETHRDWYEYHHTDAGALNLVKQIYQYLIIKKAQAEIAIKYEKTLSDDAYYVRHKGKLRRLKEETIFEREWLRLQMKGLNKKGPLAEA